MKSVIGAAALPRLMLPLPNISSHPLQGEREGSPRKATLTNPPAHKRRQANGSHRVVVRKPSGDGAAGDIVTPATAAGKSAMKLHHPDSRCSLP